MSSNVAFAEIDPDQNEAIVSAMCETVGFRRKGISREFPGRFRNEILAQYSVAQSGRGEILDPRFKTVVDGDLLGVDLYDGDFLLSSRNYRLPRWANVPKETNGMEDMAKEYLKEELGMESV